MFVSDVLISTSSHKASSGPRGSVGSSACSSQEHTGIKFRRVCIRRSWIMSSSVKSMPFFLFSFWTFRKEFCFRRSEAFAAVKINDDKASASLPSNCRFRLSGDKSAHGVLPVVHLTSSSWIDAPVYSSAVTIERIDVNDLQWYGFGHCVRSSESRFIFHAIVSIASMSGELAVSPVVQSDNWNAADSHVLGIDCKDSSNSFSFSSEDPGTE
mmetsp:Transcript_52045/g.125616  ORF Transcript_52045/g.125616 Transcript_52045/m.125616 type:complete len:212 (-) Transcript_52045:803-1438(-)